MLQLNEQGGHGGECNLLRGCAAVRILLLKKVRRTSLPVFILFKRCVKLQSKLQ